MKKLFLLGAFLWSLSALPARAQVDKPTIVVVKMQETGLATRIVIVRGWGIPEEVVVTAGLLGNEVTVMRESATKMQEVLTKLYEQGYAIKSAFSAADHGQSTLVLVKGQ